MRTIRIGGVPEHFNYPWYLTLTNKLYRTLGINLRWEDFYGGTGDMAKSLAAGEIDLAVILTEGIVKAINEGNPSLIVQEFVKTPLRWGIHVATNSNYTRVEQLRGKKAAISRYGSGSHLMAFVNAKNHGWDPRTDVGFQLVQNLDGALKALPDGTADYFMWEKFTTKPFVDNGIFRCIGECPTPWPCFVLAARKEFIREQPGYLKDILAIINDQTRDFKLIPGIDQVIARRYDQQLEDVRNWLAITEWSQEQISGSAISMVQDSLFELDLIARKLPAEEFLAEV